jgi:NAD(P)-dependent dehydrogenase (short-subunit alcohol dehydrogenase family)
VSAGHAGPIASHVAGRFAVAVAGEKPDLTGRTALVTGASGGIGLECAIALAHQGAAVMLACRSPARGAEALRRLRRETGAIDAAVVTLDLASLASVRKVASGFSGPLDILVNNAGIMATPRKLTEDGLEQQFGVNHLGHFALTGLLLPRLRQAPAPRVVTVSSLAHRHGRINFGDLQSARRYGRWRAYNQSKLANLLFALELHRRAEAAGLPLVSAAAHPGLSRTGLTGGMGYPAALDLMGGAFRLLGHPPADAAQPVVHAATAPDVEGGDYFGPDGPGETRGAPAPAALSHKALDWRSAARLWEVSEELSGVRYGLLSDGG